MLIALGIIFGAALYGQIGWQVARKSRDVWDKDDSESFSSFLLFPTCHVRGVVGQKGRSAIASFYGNDKEFYEVGMIIGWPIRLLWNLPAVIMLSGHRRVFGRLRSWIERRRELRAAKAKELPAATTVEELRRLVDQRKELDDRIHELRHGLQAQLETESHLDPDFPSG